MTRLLADHVGRLVPGCETMTPAQLADSLDAALGTTTPDSDDIEDAAERWLAAIEARKT